VHALGTGEVRTGFWWRDLWESDHVEEPDVDEMSILLWSSRESMKGRELD
jgi:hypothetical protein